MVVSARPAAQHADCSRVRTVGPASFAGDAVTTTPVNYPEQQMNVLGIFDLVGKIRKMTSTYTLHVLF